MNNREKYEARDIAGDLERLGEEIATDIERTLDETHPSDFRHEDWAAMREAIKAMREKLDEMEEMLDRAASEADAYDEDADEGEDYESFWA